jgi:hypothetical protein
MPKKVKIENSIPQWMECVWRRVPCGKKSCPVCSRLLTEHENITATVEEQDELELIFDDVASSFKETLEFIKQDVKALRINIFDLENFKIPPRPHKFSVYRKVAAWHRQVSAIINAAEIGGDLWLGTEAAADLVWYKNILLSKIYRQLCAIWWRKQGIKFSEADFRYTAFVLKEVVEILLKSLHDLSILQSGQKGALFLCLVWLQQFQPTILKLTRLSR